jgi:hypothetical protein
MKALKLFFEEKIDKLSEVKDITEIMNIFSIKS